MILRNICEDITINELLLIYNLDRFGVSLVDSDNDVDECDKLMLL